MFGNRLHNAANPFDVVDASQLAGQCNGVDPQARLADVLGRIADELLPGYWKHRKAQSPSGH